MRRPRGTRQWYRSLEGDEMFQPKVRHGINRVPNAWNDVQRARSRSWKAFRDAQFRGSRDTLVPVDETEDWCLLDFYFGKVIPEDSF